jgi:hypothetical protein
MTRIISTAFATTIVVALTAHTGYGQCLFEHPGKAKKVQVELTQAMVPCDNLGGISPNTTTEYGFPACTPPETFNELNGDPADGWHWGEKSSGKLLLKAAKKDQSGLGLDGDTATDGGADNPENIGDVQVKLKLRNVVDQTGDMASGAGSLTILVRATFKDRLNGELTTDLLPWSLPFTMVNGKATLKSSLNFAGDTGGVEPLPRCASLEIVAIQVIDVNGNAFAVPGVFIAPL